MMFYNKIICGFKYNVSINVPNENTLISIEKRSARLIEQSSFNLFPNHPNSQDIHTHYKEYLRYGEDVASLGMAFQLLRTDLSHKRDMIMNLSQDLDQFISANTRLSSDPDYFQNRFRDFFSVLKSPQAYWSTSDGIFGKSLLTPCVASSSIMSFAAKSLGYQVQYRVGWIPLTEGDIGSYEDLGLHMHLGLANENSGFVAIDGKSIIYRGDILDGPNHYNALNSHHIFSQKETILFSEILNSQYFIDGSSQTDEQVKSELAFGEVAIELDPDNIRVGKRLADNYMFLAIRLKPKNRDESLKYAFKALYIYQNLSLRFSDYYDQGNQTVSRTISREIEPNLEYIKYFINTIELNQD